MNMLFKANGERKRRICDKIIYKAMRNPVGIQQTNKRFYITVQPRNACKVEFVDHLWLLIVFQIITFQVYTILVTKWKNGIGPNDIIALN